jgi:hypothetical protein
LFLPIIAYTLSSTKLEIRAKKFLPGIEGGGAGRRGWSGWRGWGRGEMTQALYAHMNNKKIKIIKKKSWMGMWLMWYSASLASQGPEFSPQYHEKKIAAWESVSWVSVVCLKALEL